MRFAATATLLIIALATNSGLAAPISHDHQLLPRGILDSVKATSAYRALEYGANWLVKSKPKVEPPAGAGRAARLKASFSAYSPLKKAAIVGGGAAGVAVIGGAGYEAKVYTKHHNAKVVDEAATAAAVDSPTPDVTNTTVTVEKASIDGVDPAMMTTTTTTTTSTTPVDEAESV
ncbi:hypothetical protein FRB96_002476 [Tulasnella sp. 330]|nr:hypothetical protein FRB96_002476 [Tulasnella sp. 330]KAG8884676.1 hypothetical protein FRB98_002276 [Tulasnella sp. 332]